MKISARKSKGSQYELSVRDSLAQKYPDVLLTKQEGFVAQHDIIIHSAKIVVECKRHKGFSWNELVKYYRKLQSRCPETYTPFIIFQSNHQPCLVYTEYVYEGDNLGMVSRFEDYFGVPFIKHKGKKKETT